MQPFLMSADSVHIPSFRRKPEYNFSSFAFRQGSRTSAGNEMPPFIHPHPQMDSVELSPSVGSDTGMTNNTARTVGTGPPCLSNVLF